MLEAPQIAKIKESLKGNNSSLANIFGVLGDKSRFLIMKILIEQGELCVSDIAAVLDVSVSAVSQHLRILEMSQLVEGERMGQMMCYKPKINDPSVKEIINLM